MEPSGASGSGNPYITKEDYLSAKKALKFDYFQNTVLIRDLRKEICTLGQTETALKWRSQLQSQIAHLSFDQRAIIDELTFLRLRADYSKGQDFVFNSEERANEL